jgi:DNA-binding response OmpR family regulator
VAPPASERVLVIEDDADLREVLTYNLTAAGFEVHTRSAGRDGLAAVRVLEPDIVLGGRDRVREG